MTSVRFTLALVIHFEKTNHILIFIKLVTGASLLFLKSKIKRLTQNGGFKNKRGL